MKLMAPASHFRKLKRRAFCGQATAFKLSLTSIKIFLHELLDMEENAIILFFFHFGIQSWLIKIVIYLGFNFMISFDF